MFEEFWKAYPIRKGKEPARKAFEKALKSGAGFDAIMAGLEAYKRELGQIVGGKTLDGRTPKWAQGWLNDRRWEDEPDGPSLDDQWRAAIGGPTDPCARLGHLWITNGTCGRCGAAGGPA